MSSRAVLGYARISTAGQSLDVQVDALVAAGCQRVFTDTVSGAQRTRPGLAALLDHVRPGDEVVAVKLDRFGRSIVGIHELIDSLTGQGVLVRTLDGLTTDPGQLGGKVLISVMAAMAEVERDLIRDRTMRGLEAARARGRVGGRRRALTPSQEKSVVALHAAGESSAQGLAEDFGVSRATIYRVLDRAGVGAQAKPPHTEEVKEVSKVNAFRADR